MLTHRNVATTQIYTEVMDKKKREAAESITLKKK
jgi:site-specific recombinase XerD